MVCLPACNFADVCLSLRDNVHSSSYGRTIRLAVNKLQCRESIAQSEQHAAELQAQCDAAQTDMSETASQLREALHGRSSLENQLQQVAKQLSASEQLQIEVSEHCYTHII